jgi:hypothetical protein
MGIHQSYVFSPGKLILDLEVWVLCLVVHFWLCFVKCFFWLYSVFILNFHLYISIWIFYSVSVLEKYIRELVPFCGVFFADWIQNVYRKMV